MVFDAAQEQQRLRLSILGRQPYSGADRIGGASEADWPAIDGDGAGERAVVPENRLCCFRASGAHQSGQADDLARVNIETQILDALCRQTAHREDAVASAPRLTVEEGGDPPSDHRLNDLRLRKVRGRTLLDQASITEHRGAVG